MEVFTCCNECMQKNVFIGIDVDAHLKQTLAKTIKPWQDLPIRWHKTDGLHVALLPLGWMGDDDVLDVMHTLSTVSADIAMFQVHFTYIAFTAKDPHNTDIRDAQIVRLVGEHSPELHALYTTLSETFHTATHPKNTFKPFVELGRMRFAKWHALETYPAEHTPFACTMDVSALTLFEVANIDGVRTIVPVDVCMLR